MGLGTVWLEVSPGGHVGRRGRATRERAQRVGTAVAPVVGGVGRVCVLTR